MRQTFFIIVILFFGSYSSTAQKTIQKEFSSKDIHLLSIEDDAIFKIEIHSSEETGIKITLHVSGEHSENVIIEEKISEGKLSLNTGFTPFFTLENDKLAAHKVMAVEMQITLPKSMAIEIKSKLASVYINGAFENLNISLENGSCVLSDFLGNAHLKTIAGNIAVLAKKDVSGQAISKKGAVENTLAEHGKFLVVAESIKGSISLSQTE
ncbi:MAG: hypothetical protein JJE55_13755 [Flavobacteriaceae bacterium]|nr:hypothetical protein [Flavobacteriaceae bacterium]